MVNEIATAFIENSQIQGAFKAKRLTLELLKKRQNFLTIENKEKLKEWL